MVIEQTEDVLFKFFTLDVLNQKQRTIKSFNSLEKNTAGRLFENEWLQEYELIYALQELEDWNLEEADNT
jgi:hypothetical protein